MVEFDAEPEQHRLSTLKQLDVLDTAPEAPFENIVRIIRTVMSVPIATVTLVDAERQWFKARSGIAEIETPRAISFCTHTIEQDTPLVVSDAAADQRFACNPLVTSGPGIRSYAGVQLTTSDGQHVGTLCAIDTRPREYSVAEIALLTEFSKVVVNEFELHRRADKDHLTGAYTRQAFARHATCEIERHRRYADPASLILFDVDHFKRVNDEFGHGGGDEVLRAIARTVREAIRPTDYFARVGGEEFAVLLPQTTGPDAIATAERLRQAIAMHAVHIDGHDRAVTASFGISELGNGLDGLEAWMGDADAQLYSAKRSGRNRCVSAIRHEKPMWKAIA